MPKFTLEERNDIVGRAQIILLAVQALGFGRNEKTAAALRLLAAACTNEKVFESEAALRAELDFQIAELERVS